MDTYLLLRMAERLCVVAMIAFILSQTDLFRRLNYNDPAWHDRFKLSVIFGMIGIAGTYTAIPVDDALANSRAVGVMTAGFVGGPAVGCGAGLIAGIHRYSIGGFTAFSCALASIFEGIFAGMVKLFYPKQMVPWWVALVSGIAGEMLHMAIVLTTAKPPEMAMQLVGTIALPMIMANPLGLGIFILMVKTTVEAQRQAGALQAEKVLLIATKTLPHFRQGITAKSAEAVADIIYQYSGYHAVEITDRQKIIAYVGVATSYHCSGGQLTIAQQAALEQDSVYLATSPPEIGCGHQGCLLKSAIIAPLRCDNRVVGLFTLYYTVPELMNQSDFVFANGLAQLFSVQLELAEAERLSKQVARAELKALQAQINPHFLFNTLNTIISLVRTQPALARDLLIKLSGIFRFTLHKTGKEIILAEELERVRAYIAIEQARYGDKVTFCENITVNPALYSIASLTIQPIIENAIKHGLKPKIGGGTITLGIEIFDDCIKISVLDDGVGFDAEAYNPLKVEMKGHIGLRNVHERLKSQYGDSYGVTIISKPGKGTTVIISVPKIMAMEEESDAKSIDCG